jgi:hypothetical protein
MKRRLKENIEIGDRVFAPRDQYEGTVIDIDGNEVLVDGPFGEEYHNLNDLEKLGGHYKKDDENPDFFNKYFTESSLKRKKIIRLTESDLARIVKRVIRENRNASIRSVIDFETGEMVGTHQYGIGFVPNKIGLEMGYTEDPTSIPDGTKFEDSSMETRMATRIMSPRGYGNRYEY